MYPANAHAIRLATPADAAVLAGLDGHLPPSGRILIGEIDGEAAAALRIADGRVVRRPGPRVDRLVGSLRRRAAAMVVHERTPLLRERMLAALFRRLV